MKRTWLIEIKECVELILFRNIAGDYE